MEHAEQPLRQQLYEALGRELACGRRNVLLVHGGAGLGKTELLQRMAGHARASGQSVLHAVADPAERGFTFGVVGHWFHAITDNGYERRRTGRLLDAAAAAATRALADDNPDSPAVVTQFQKLYVNLRETAQKRPLVLQLDDAHHADPASLLFVLHVVRRMPGTSLRLMLTELADTAPPLPAVRREMLGHPHVLRHVMAPLSETEIAEFLRRDAQAGAAPGSAADHRHVSGGNPALLVAAAADHRCHGAPHRDGYGRTFVQMLRRTDPLCLQAVQAEAVLPEATPAETAWLLDVDATALQDSVHRASAAGLLTAGRPRHPAAADAALAAMTAAEVAGLHRRAAQLRYLQGAAEETIAHHLVRAGRPHPPWAAGVLERAATTAATTGDVRLAADRLKVAVAASQDGTRAVLRSRLAQLEAEVSPAAAALHLGALVAADHLDQLDIDDRIALARALLWQGRTAEADHTLTSLRAGARTPAVACFEHWLRSAHPGVATEPSTEPVQGPAAGFWLQRNAALAQRLVADDRRGACTLAEEMLHDLEPGRGGVWALEAALQALATLNGADRTAAVTAHCDRLFGDRAVERAPVWQAILAGARAEAALRQGNLAVAVDHSQAALTHLTRKSWGVVVGQPLGVLVLASVRAGEYEEAAQWLALPMTGALAQGRWAPGYLQARAGYHLATGQVQAALDDFLSCGALSRRWHCPDAGMVSWRTGAAEVHLKRGELDEAQRLLADELRTSCSPRAQAAALRLQAHLVPPARAEAELARALTLFESCGDRYEQGRTLAHLSRTHQLADEKARARTTFRRAWHLATACEAAPLRRDLLAARQDDSPLAGEVSVAGGPSVSSAPAALADLTVSERRVASLAVLGYTNREIATKLFITLSTVEQHLTRVYRKLDVSNRRDLPSWLTSEMVTSA